MSDSVSSRPARSVAWSNSAVIEWMRARLAASGGDPASIPAEPFAFWRIDEIERRIGVKRSTVYRWISENTFPHSIALGIPDQRQPRAAA